MRYHPTLIVTVMVALTLGFISPLLAAEQAEVDQLRADYAKLKAEMDQTLAQMRELKQQLAAPAAPVPAQEQPVTDTSLDQKIDRLITAQTNLEKKLDALAAQQAQADRARQQQAATPVPNDLNSPYAYRYNANTPSPSPGSSNPDTNAPQPVNATYTTYSNGYTSGYYVPPVQPVQTTGQIVYVNPQPTVVYTTPTYIYSDWCRPYPYYSPYYSSYYRYPRHYRSGLSVGVYDDHFYFGVGTGVRFGGRDYHHHRH